MPNQITISDVEYADISAQTLPDATTNLAALDAIRDRIKKRDKTYQIETGRDLIKAKALLPHGAFGQWLADNFDWSDSTAHSYMNAARLADETPEVEKLAPAALRALAAPNTPDTVRSEVVVDIKAGNLPSTKTVKAKIATAKAKAATDKAPKPAPANHPASATVTVLPPKADAPVAPKASENNDLIERLRAAGLDAARKAFEAAFPGYAVTDLDELHATIEREKAA
jgi:hypothetical protein